MEINYLNKNHGHGKSGSIQTKKAITGIIVNFLQIGEFVCLIICFLEMRKLTEEPNILRSLTGTEIRRRKHSNAITATGHLIIWLVKYSFVIALIVTNISWIRQLRHLRFVIFLMRSSDAFVIPFCWLLAIPDLRRSLPIFKFT